MEGPKRVPSRHRFKCLCPSASKPRHLTCSVPCRGTADRNDHGRRQQKRGRRGGRTQQARSASAAQSAAAALSYSTKRCLTHLEYFVSSEKHNGGFV